MACQFQSLLRRCAARVRRPHRIPKAKVEDAPVHVDRSSLFIAPPDIRRIQLPSLRFACTQRKKVGFLGVSCNSFVEHHSLRPLGGSFTTALTCLNRNELYPVPRRKDKYSSRWFSVGLFGVGEADLSCGWSDWVVNTSAEAARLEPRVDSTSMSYRNTDEGTVSTQFGNTNCGEELEKLVVVLDLDETLVHTHVDRRKPHDFVVSIPGSPPMFVSKRPGCEAFLKHVSLHYEVALFTAGVETYASSVMSCIDPEGKFIRPWNRYYRGHCFPISLRSPPTSPLSSVHPPTSARPRAMRETIFLKDISCIRSNLSRTVLVDNSLFSFVLCPDNGIPMEDWIGPVEGTAGGSSTNTNQRREGGGLSIESCNNPLLARWPISVIDAARFFVVGDGHQGKGDETGVQVSHTTDHTRCGSETLDSKALEDFYHVCVTLEMLSKVRDVRPVLRSKFRIAEEVAHLCAAGMRMAAT